LPWCLTALLLYVLVLHISWRRCKWALTEWGSDHLPVTVEFTVKPLAEVGIDREKSRLQSR
jgi:hypothetical protein